MTEFDLFSWLAAHGPVTSAGLRAGLGLAERPADVLLTYCALVFRSFLALSLVRGSRGHAGDEWFVDLGV